MATMSTGHARRGEIAETRSGFALVALVAHDEVTKRRAHAVLAREGFEVAHATVLALVTAPVDGEAGAVVLACGAAAIDDEVQALRAQRPELVVVVVAPSDDRHTVRTALAAGADGYVSEACIESSLPSTVRAAAAGQVCVPRAAREVLGVPSFSHREKQVLCLVARGFTNGQIARRLYLAESTVKSHLSTSYQKLGVRSRRDAAALVLDLDSQLNLRVLDQADSY